MGWIGGVVAANYLCSQHRFKNNEPSICTYNPIKIYMDTIKHMMDNDGCKTLQDKKQYIRKLQCFKFDFGDEERNQCYEFAIEHLLRDIEFELENEYYKNKYRYII